MTSDDVPTGHDAVDGAITDVDAWLDGMVLDARPTFRALGELLLGVAVGGVENAERFTARHLEVSSSTKLVKEASELTPVAGITTAIALTEWIDQYADDCIVGPGYRNEPPEWTQTDVGDAHYQHALCLRAYFPPGTVLDAAGAVVSIQAVATSLNKAQVSVFVTPNNQNHARGLLDRLSTRAKELNPFRGRVVRASVVTDGFLTKGGAWTVIDLPPVASRENIVVPEDVWYEIDLAITAVRDHHSMLSAHGLSTRRGVLLCGPPGTGKSAATAAVANELAGEFTVVYVDARAGAKLLTNVVDEAQSGGGPVLLVLEDIDLWCGRRESSFGSGGLSELLQAMDAAPDARILTLASTNDPRALDPAATRTGRFDSVVEIDYPNHSAAARIVTALTSGLPGAQSINAATIADALPDKTSGSDIREIVRRAVLAAGDGSVSGAALLNEIRNGRYKAAAPAGMYL